MEGVEEYLEDIGLVILENTRESSNSREYWEGIRQQLMEVAELTCQTSQFEQCCPREADESCCPFYSHHMPAPVVNSPVRRGSAPPSQHISLHPRKDVSYGGFERIMNSYYDSDFEIEEAGDEIWADAKETFRRNRGGPVRKKKTHSTSLPRLDPESILYARKRTNTLPSLTD